MQYACLGCDQNLFSLSEAMNFIAVLTVKFIYFFFVYKNTFSKRKHPPKSFLGQFLIQKKKLGLIWIFGVQDNREKRLQ